MQRLGAMTIDNVFPWGRSFDEYRLMFNLTDGDLESRIIACADGPASFNAEMARRGKRVISCDPLYGFEADVIRGRIEATSTIMIDWVRQNRDRFVWDRIRSPDELGWQRGRAMHDFLDDYDLGREQGRYLQQSLPVLEFADKRFDLALCSHFLFLYSGQFDFKFHVASVVEMSRIAVEVRIFSVLDMEGQRSIHLDPLLEYLNEAGFDAKVEKTPYEFQRGGNELVRIGHS